MTLVYDWKKQRTIKRRGHKKPKLNHDMINFKVTDFPAGSNPADQNKTGEFAPVEVLARASSPEIKGCAINDK